MRLAPRASTLLLALFGAAVACNAGQDPAPADGAPAAGSQAEEQARDPMVGYDVRRLRPREAEPLSVTFENQRERALAEGKQVAVLFSADWCEQCKVIDLELGNMHPRSTIGHVRVLELKEEDWEPVTRMNEFNELRRRWSAPLNVYPLFVLLDEDGTKVEEMDEAKMRLEGMGIEATLDRWFESRRET